MKKAIVIKLGTSSITDSKGNLVIDLLENIVEQIAELKKKYNVILVSSGAVGTGKNFINNYTGELKQRKAAAAIGNPLLMNQYSEWFLKHKIVTAQCLLERQHFSNRPSFLQLKNTIETLWGNNVLPIANDNDVVNDIALRFSDNDQLASLLAINFDAERLLIGSSVEGLLDADNHLVKEVKDLDGEILSLARKETSGGGLGGMISKLNSTKLATDMGVAVTIFDAKQKGNLLKAYNKETGTYFYPVEKQLDARKKWMASGAKVVGKIIIDSGAEKALKERKSLLSVGVLEVLTSFEKGEVIEIIGKNQNMIAIALSKKSSENIKNQSVEVANASDIVLFS